MRNALIYKKPSNYQEGSEESDTCALRILLAQKNLSGTSGSKAFDLVYCSSGKAECHNCPPLFAEVRVEITAPHGNERIDHRASNSDDLGKFCQGYKSAGDILNPFT